MLLCSRSAAVPGPAAAAGSWRRAPPADAGRCICRRCVMSRATGCTLPPAAEGDAEAAAAAFAASSCACCSCCCCCWPCLPVPVLLLLLVMTMAAAPGLYPQLWLLLPLPCDRPPEPLAALPLWLSKGSVAALRLPPPLALPPAALLPAPSGRYPAAPLGDTQMLGTQLP